MRSNLGIRYAYSQPYHHRANGRVERAGQDLMERLRKLFVQEKVNWVEALPQVLDRYHDTPGRGGLSPYEILFGRSRPLAGRTYQPPVICEDACNFFTRMWEIDRKISLVLKEEHEKEAKRPNERMADPVSLPIGQKVWYRRPEGTGDKLDTRWIGPGVVKSRTGEYSYIFRNKTRSFSDSPACIPKIVLG